MSKLKIKGDVRRIQNDPALWSVVEQLLRQPHQLTRQFKVRGVEGEVTLDSSSSPVVGVVDLIKSFNPSGEAGGEVALVGELSDMMGRAHEARIAGLLKSLPKADK